MPSVSCKHLTVDWLICCTSVQDVLLWRTEILTEGFPLLFGAPLALSIALLFALC